MRKQFKDESGKE